MARYSPDRAREHGPLHQSLLGSGCCVDPDQEAKRGQTRSAPGYYCIMIRLQLNDIWLNGGGDRDFDSDADYDQGLAVEESQPKTKKPPMYRVILLNDDYTPMEFVVEVLQLIFGMDRQKATRIMLEVHTQGKGVCGIFTYGIAETKVAQVSAFAEQHQHPLLCTMEEI